MFVCVFMCMFVSVCPSLKVEQNEILTKSQKKVKLILIVSSTMDNSLETNSLFFFLLFKIFMNFLKFSLFVQPMQA